MKTCETVLKASLLLNCSLCLAMASAALFACFENSSVISKPFLPICVFCASSIPLDILDLMASNCSIICCELFAVSDSMLCCQRNRHLLNSKV